MEPMPPAPQVPEVLGTLSIPNDMAIDPTLAVRAIDAPAAAGFDVTVTAPDAPVIVFSLDRIRRP